MHFAFRRAAAVALLHRDLILLMVLGDLALIALRGVAAGPILRFVALPLSVVGHECLRFPC